MMRTLRGTLDNLFSRYMNFEVYRVSYELSERGSFSIEYIHVGEEQT